MPSPPGVSVRAVLSTDSQAWKDLRESLWSGERHRHADDIASFFAGTLEEPTAVLVAETTAGELVGLVELSIRSDILGLLGQRTGYVEGLYVAPSHRFRGVARALLEAGQTWALQEGCTAFATDREDRIIVIRSFARLFS